MRSATKEKIQNEDKKNHTISIELIYILIYKQLNVEQ